MPYTNKDQIRVVLVVDQWRIEGLMHVLSQSRLTDALNSKSKDFLAVTEAKVYDVMTNKLLFQAEWLDVNRMSISVIFPAQ